MLEINSSPLDSKPGHAYQTLRCTHSVVVPNELFRSIGREVSHDQLNQGFLGAGLAEGYCVLCVGASVEGRFIGSYHRVVLAATELLSSLQFYLYQYSLWCIYCVDPSTDQVTVAIQ